MKMTLSKIQHVPGVFINMIGTCVCVRVIVYCAFVDHYLLLALHEESKNGLSLLLHMQKRQVNCSMRYECDVSWRPAWTMMAVAGTTTQTNARLHFFFTSPERAANAVPCDVTRINLLN